MKWTEKPRDVAKRFRTLSSLLIAGAALLFARGFFAQFHPTVRGKWNPLSAELTAWDAMVQGVSLASPVVLMAIVTYFAAKYFHYLADNELLKKEESEAAARLAKELTNAAPLPKPLAAPARKSVPQPQERFVDDHPRTADVAAAYDDEHEDLDDRPIIEREVAGREVAGREVVERDAHRRPAQVRGRDIPSRRESTRPAAAVAPRSAIPDRRPDRERPDPRVSKGRPAGSPGKRETILRPATEPRLPDPRQSPPRQRPAAAAARPERLRRNEKIERPTARPRPQVQGARPGSPQPRVSESARPRPEVRRDEGKAAADEAIAKAKKLLKEARDN